MGAEGAGTMPGAILLRAPNWLGDCIMALPALASLRARFPRSRLRVACPAALSACFCASPDADGVVPLPARNGWGGRVAFWRGATALRKETVDCGILLTNSFSSALWMRLTGARRRVGFDRDGRGLLLTDRVPCTPGIAAAHQAEYYLHLVGVLGGRTTRNDPSLAVPETGRREAATLREANGLDGPYAVIAPASAYGPVKDWSGERYAAVARRMHEAWGWRSVLVGVPADRTACGAIAERAGSAAVNLAGRTSLAGLFGLMERGALFCGGDSGGAHAAAALGVPTVAIFGITEPSRTRALGSCVICVGEGGEATPRLRDPAVRERARRMLDAVTVDAVWKALERAREAGGGKHG